MDKGLLVSTINRYYLNGLVESVKWVSAKDLSIDFVAISGDIIGNITLENSVFPKLTLGVYNTSQLLKLLSIFDDFIEVDYEFNDGIVSTLNIKDSIFSLDYALADLDIIKIVPTFADNVKFELECNLETNFMHNFIRAKQALGNESNECMVSIELDENNKYSKLQFLLGTNSSFSHSVKLSAEVEFDGFPFSPLKFSSLSLKEIFNINKNSESSKIYINGEGAMKLEFQLLNIKSTYYLIAIDE